MTIKRGGIAEPISGNIHKKEIPVYCPNCHYPHKLGPRIYKEEELVFGQIPYDADQWKQCHHCGHLVATYDIAQQGTLTTDIEKIDTKFKTQKGSGSEHLPKPKHRRGFNDRLLEDRNQGDIKDEDVKKELKKGAKLISYSEI